MKRIPKIIRYTGIVILIFFILMLGFVSWTWYILQQPEYQKILGSKITEHLPEPWSRNTHIERIGGRLPGYFCLYGVTANDEHGNEIKLREIRLSWDWKALWHKQFIINSVFISGLQAKITQEESGKWLSDLQTHSTSDQTETNTPSTTLTSLLEFGYRLSSLRIEDLALQLSAYHPKNDSPQLWNQAHVYIKNININAHLEKLSSELLGQFNFSTNLGFKIDQQSPLEFAVSGNILSLSSGLDVKISQFKGNTPLSKINIKGQAHIDGQWWKSLDQPEIILDKLSSHLEIFETEIATSDIQTYLSKNFILPNLVSLKADLSYKNRQFTQSISLEGGLSRLIISNSIEHFNSQLNANFINLNVDVNSELQDWLPEAKGVIKLNLRSQGNPNQLQNFQIKQNFTLSQTSYKEVQYPPVSANLQFDHHHLTTEIKVGDTDVQFSLQAKAQTPPCLSWRDLSINNLNFEVQQSANLQNLSATAALLKNLIPTKLKLAGSLSENMSLSGNIQQLQYQIKLNTQNLMASTEWPKQMQLLISGNIQPEKIFQESPPTPSFYKDAEHLKEDIQLIGPFLQEWLERIEWPRLEWTGNEMLTNLDKFEIILSPGAKKSLSISVQAWHETIHILEFNAEMDPQPEKLHLQISKCSSQLSLLLPQPWPWLDHAFELQQIAQCDLYWQTAQLKWSGFEFGTDKWLISHGDIQADGQWEAKLKLQSPDIGESTSHLGITLPFNMSGHFNLDLDSTGTWWRPEHQIDLVSSDIVIKKIDLPPLILSDASLHIEQISGANGSIKAQVAIVPQGDPGFELSAQLPLIYSDNLWIPDWKQTLQYSIGPRDEKPMNLERFAPLLSHVVKNLKGTWLLQIKGSAEMAHPELQQFEGQLKIQGGQGQLVAFPQAFDHVEADVHFSPQLVNIQSFQLKNKDGQINLEGQVSSNGILTWNKPQWQLNLQSQNWRTKIPPQLSLTSDANLTLAGNLSSHEVLGLVNISNTIINPQINFLTPENLTFRDPNLHMVEELLPWPVFDAKSTGVNFFAPNLLKMAIVRIKIQLGRNNWVRHDMFTGELVGQINVEKHQGQDSLFPKGKLNLQRAVLRFQGKRFTMEQGDLIWQGDMIPAVNMVFLSHVNPYDIKIILQADQVDKVQPNLSSQPWLDNSDIISVLLVGHPMHAESNNSPKSNTLGQDIAISQGAAQLSKQMGLQNLGVEVEDVNKSGGTVRVGRYLWPRLYVSAAKTMGDTENQELSAEFLILKNLKFKTTQETETPLGFDLEWSLDY